MERLSVINKYIELVFVASIGCIGGNVNCMGIFEDLIYTFVIFQKPT